MAGDCCECGACCFSDSSTYVPVTKTDAQKLASQAQQATTRIADSLYLRMEGGRCAQLKYLEGDWICQIYAQRPQACRLLKRGSPVCMVERTLKRAIVKRASRLRQDRAPPAEDHERE